MSDVVDLNCISGLVLGLDREMRLMRPRVDNLAGTVPQRLAVLEQSFHDLTGETARGFNQTRRQLASHEKRFDGLDAALAKLSTELAESTARLVREIRANGR